MVAVKNLREVMEPLMLKKTISGFTFYYNPSEIKFTPEIHKYLEGFRTEDGEDSFVLTMDEEGLVVY